MWGGVMNMANKSLYVFEVHVKPKIGGKEYDINLEVYATSQSKAERCIKKHLRNESDIPSSYKLIETAGLEI